MTGAADIVAATYNATVRKTYVDYNNADTSFGQIAQGTATISGYNRINDGVVGFGNTGWGVNYITYVQVDASAIRNSGMVTGATLTASDRPHGAWATTTPHGLMP